MRRAPILVSLLAPLVLGGPALAASGGAPGDGAAVVAPVLDLHFDGGRPGSTVSGVSVTNSGTAATTTSVITRGTAVAGSPTQQPRASFRPGVDAAAGTSIRLPGWVAPDVDPPLAVLGIVNTTTPQTPATDPLNPGSQPFTWRADFKLDRESGQSGSDGDNLFQRGLSPNTLWKLQIDHGKASCTIRSASPSTGAVTEVATSPITINRNQWYRGICARTAQSQLTIEVQKYVEGAWQSISTATATKRVVGTVAMAPATPVSVGGKLRTATEIVRAEQSPSQFNGFVDNAVLTIG